MFMGVILVQLTRFVFYFLTFGVRVVYKHTLCVGVGMGVCACACVCVPARRVHCQVSLSLILCHNLEFTSKLLGSGSVTIVLGFPALLCQACHVGARDLNSGP